MVKNDKKCWVCKKPLGKDFEWLGSPFYAKLRVLCDACAKDKKDMIKAQLNTKGGKN